jgi:hypothetical protein
MTPKEQREIQEHIEAISKILYKNTPQEQLQTFEAIEITLRDQILTEISPKIGEFFLTEGKRRKAAEQEKSKAV